MEDNGFEKEDFTKEYIMRLETKLKQIGMPEEFISKPAFIEYIAGIVDVDDDKLMYSDSLLGTIKKGDFERLATTKRNECSRFYYQDSAEIKESLGYTDAGVIKDASYEICDATNCYTKKFDYKIKTPGYISRYCDGREKSCMVDFGFISVDDLLKYGVNVHRISNINYNDVMKKYDEYALQVTEKYPEMAEFYKDRRDDVIYSLIKEHYFSGRLMITDEELKATGISKCELDLMNELSQKNQELMNSRNQLEILKDQNIILTEKLGKTLKFIETVKKSPVGKLFFGKKLESIPQKTRQDSERI